MLPMGSTVMWTSKEYGNVPGEVFGHQTCSILFKVTDVVQILMCLPQEVMRVPRSQVKMLDVHRIGERPWWRTMHDKADPGKRNRRRLDKRKQYLHKHPKHDAHVKVWENHWDDPVAWNEF